MEYAEQAGVMKTDDEQHGFVSCAEN